MNKPKYNKQDCESHNINGTIVFQETKRTSLLILGLFNVAVSYTVKFLYWYSRYANYKSRASLLYHLAWLQDRGVSYTVSCRRKLRLQSKSLRKIIYHHQ
jgi:hypothetical protein